MTTVCGTNFDIDITRYSIIKPIGQGAYGVVVAAKDLRTGEKVAIKKIAKAFDHLTDGKRTLRELKLLRHFEHENVIGIKEIMKPRNFENFEDVYIVSELMDTDLHQIIGSPQGLSDDHCQYFVYQILRGLKYVHSASVLHRDLKPSNLLVNGNCDLKICDFGLARVSNPEENHGGFLTEYVATRWYRAPEIMLSWKEYTKAIDMWSVGCIFAELLARKPLFPGRDYIHQLHLITDLIGTPSDADMANIGSEKARRYIKTLPQKQPVPLEKLFPEATPAAIDLLGKMLIFNPQRRITVEEALAHPYLVALHDPSDEPVATTNFKFDFENVPMTKELLKEWIYAELLDFNGEHYEGPHTKKLKENPPPPSAATSASSATSATSAIEKEEMQI